MVYHLVSLAPTRAVRLRLKVRRCPSGDDPRLRRPSVWPSATWLEREVWDLFGIGFDGHRTCAAC